MINLAAKYSGCYEWRIMNWTCSIYHVFTPEQMKSGSGAMRRPSFLHDHCEEYSLATIQQQNQLHSGKAHWPYFKKWESEKKTSPRKFRSKEKWSEQCANRTGFSSIVLHANQDVRWNWLLRFKASKDPRFGNDHPCYFTLILIHTDHYQCHPESGRMQIIHDRKINNRQQVQ